EDGASIVNTGGTLEIDGDNSYAMYTNGSGTAENTGTINVNSTNSHGMYAKDNGSLTNSAPKGIINVIGNGSSAMTAAAADASLTNTGVINIRGLQANGLNIINGGGSTTATNSGTINFYASNSASINGAAMAAVNGTLVNDTTGQINITGTGDGMKGIATTEYGSSLENKGSIVISGSGDAMKALINSGIASDAIVNTITNSGTVTSTNSGNGINAQRANITNSAGATISLAKGGTAINATDSTGSNTVTNDGVITITGTDDAAAIGIQTDSSGYTVTNSQSGTITITGTNATGVIAGGGSVNNSGNIAVDAQSGKGIVTLSSASATNTGKIYVNGANATGVDAQGSSSAANKGTINVSGSNAKGMSASVSASVTNNADEGLNGKESSSKILVSGEGSIGIYTYSASAKGTNYGNIEVTGKNASGMLAQSGTVTNDVNEIPIYDDKGNQTGTESYVAYINVNGDNAIGMTAGNGSAINKAIIDVNNGIGMKVTGSGTATNETNGIINVSNSGRYGMYVTGTGSAVNNGSIVVNNTANSGSVSYGMYAVNGGTITNNGTITMTGNTDNLIGMYANGAGSSIVNTGEITINSSALSNATCTPGDTSGCGKFIVVENGATFTNNATVISAAALNLNTFAADSLSKVMLGRSGSFIAPEISGDAVAAADIVTTGEQLDEYVNEDSFIGEDTGINVSSGSYMFDASTKTNDNGNIDVVMSRKAFASIVDNQEIASYLETNYGLNNSIYNAMMSASSADSFATATAESLGLNLIPNFAKQNLDVIKSLDRQINNAVLGNDDKKPMRAMVGYDFFRRKQDGTGLLSGYKDYANSAYGIFDKAYDNNLRYGFALSFTQLDSDYDNGSERDEFITQAMAILSYDNDDFSFVSAPRLGIGFGDYERQTSDGTYKADTRNYYYGISNEARKDIDMGSFALQPVAEFNVLGLYQDNMKEKGHLEVNSANNVSVEGGLGLYAKKEYELTEDDVLKLRLGGTYYHEFNNPYQAAKARIDGLNGSYHMDSYDAQRDRGVLSARADYKHNEFNFYAEINKYLEEDDGYSINAGVGYRF
ncbi:MAG: hypothetical protein ACI4OW_03935, partial [Alphaproteobacteria bacterium]